MRFIASSDWHGDTYTHGYSRFAEVRDAVGESITHAIETRADGYMFLGDLTDPHHSRSHKVVGWAAEQAARLAEAGIPSLWLVGNHDVIEDGSGAHTMLALAEVHALVMVIDTPGHYVFAGVNIIALPFTPRSHTYDPEQVVEGIFDAHGAMPRLMVVGHLSLDGMHPGSETLEMPRGRDIMWPLGALEAHYPDALKLGGHYHRRQVAHGVHIIGAPVRFTHGEEDNDPGFCSVEI